MTSKIVRADGTTISNIKSCVYTEKVNADTDLRPGCVASAMIDVEVYGAQSSAPASGEALTYYQVDSEGNETLIGVFYAEPTIATKATYSFTAYDAVSKLDVDFSDRLKNLSFPMTIYSIVSEACSVAGITLGSSSWPFSNLQTQAFYADGMTCRNILQYAAEIACRFVRCNTAGELVFEWYTENENLIHPSTKDTENIDFTTSESTQYDGFLQTSSINVATNNTVKLELEYDTQKYRYVYIRYGWTVGSNGYAYTRVTQTNAQYYVFTQTLPDSAASGTNGYVYFIYPEGATRAVITKTTTEDFIAYKQDGLKYENFETSEIESVSITAPGEDAISYVYAAQNLYPSDDIYPSDELFPSNSASTMIIANNLLMSGWEQDTFFEVASAIYQSIRDIDNYRPAKINLFPNENPFRAGDIVSVTDIQGVTFTTLVMSMTVSAQMAQLESTGNETYSINPYSATSVNLNVSNAINKLSNVKVGKITVEDGNGNIIFEADADEGTVQIADWTANSDYLESHNASTNILYMRMGQGRIETVGGDIVPMVMQKVVPLTGTYEGYGIRINLPVQDTNFVTEFSIYAGTRQMFLVEAYSDSSSDVPYSGSVEIGDSTTSYALRVNSRNILSEIGTLSNLDTTAQGSLVAAINELVSRVEALETATYPNG